MIFLRFGKFKNVRIPRPTKLELVALALMLLSMLAALQLWRAVH
jgi:hypothetical protein